MIREIYNRGAGRCGASNRITRSTRIGSLALCIALLMLQGCVIPPHRGVVNEVPVPPVNRVTNKFPTHLYSVAEGDVLELMFLTRPQASRAPYRLQVKDAIDVEFAFHPELNRTVRVRPDGSVGIPRKKDVRVAGMTADEVSSMLTRTYSDVFKDPQVSVNVREFNVKLDELQRALATAPHGQARLVTVRPDGRVSLPLVNEVTAVGKTIPQLNAMINKRYAAIMPEINVSVLLREIVGNVVFVDGEVAKPGVFNTKGPITVQHAIALAGGIKETAEPRTVLVVTKSPEGRFLARTTDLTRVTSDTDYVLNRNDLVFVPMSKIARADVWVDQNIKRLLLFTGWNVGIQADLGRTSFSR
jgi:polysaccharide biosynthesis/export protein